MWIGVLATTSHHRLLPCRRTKGRKTFAPVQRRRTGRLSTGRGSCRTMMSLFSDSCEVLRKTPSSPQFIPHDTSPFTPYLFSFAPLLCSSFVCLPFLVFRWRYLTPEFCSHSSHLENISYLITPLPFLSSLCRRPHQWVRDDPPRRRPLRFGPAQREASPRHLERR